MCESLMCERSCHCRLSVTVYCACYSCLWDRVSHHLAVLSAARVTRICEIELVIGRVCYSCLWDRVSRSSSRCYISRTCYSCLWDRVSYHLAVISAARVTRVVRSSQSHHLTVTINRICLLSLWDRARVTSSVCLSLTINRVCPSCLRDRVTVIRLSVTF